MEMPCLLRSQNRQCRMSPKQHSWMQSSVERRLEFVSNETSKVCESLPRVAWLVAPSVPSAQPAAKDAFAENAGLYSVTLGAGKALCSTICESNEVVTWFSPYFEPCASAVAAKRRDAVKVAIWFAAAWHTSLPCRAAVPLYPFLQSA